ncbi:hypothetical protein Tcan_02517 [Toxocara canis]|uniref:Uncharacterized protein n=1 Tax=Toxocara canis TaxID=6265 RepID=A0A0B2UQ26_TOXCA|nr:hypothetical protein Tcan_02517 [Toxocara canis]
MSATSVGAPGIRAEVSNESVPSVKDVKRSFLNVSKVAKVRFLESLLEVRGDKKRVSVHLEANSVFSREQVTLTVLVVLIICMIFGSLARLICNLVGFAYPAYASAKVSIGLYVGVSRNVRHCPSRQGKSLVFLKSLVEQSFPSSCLMLRLTPISSYNERAWLCCTAVLLRTSQSHRQQVRAKKAPRLNYVRSATMKCLECGDQDMDDDDLRDT